MPKKDRKGRIFYEVTREKPMTPPETMLASGAVGAAVGFFFMLLGGAALGRIPLDGMVLLSLLAAVLGFAAGFATALLLWRHFHFLAQEASDGGMVVKADGTEAINDLEQKSAGNAASEVSDTTGVEEKNDSSKHGSSVDYVFPEFAPDRS